MVNHIKYTDEMVAEALAMRARGEKQAVIHATFGEGIESAIRRVAAVPTWAGLNSICRLARLRHWSGCARLPAMHRWRCCRNRSTSSTSYWLATGPHSTRGCGTGITWRVLQVGTLNGLEVTAMNSAVLSECGKYRYRLDRDVQTEGLVFAYFGINPSTADATLDDPTVRKWRGFTQRNGGRKFIVGNVFAYRSTDPKALGQLSVEDACGPEQFAHVLNIIAEADVLVPCWGNIHKVPRTHRKCIASLTDVLLGFGKPVLHFGTTDSGSPRHPLMLSYDTPMLPWGGYQ